ncbi:kinesin-5 [Plasmodium sp. DRC-Itaito]|nr:kinesin-5 [Plasmodium sp. DRC-Itaito]
MLRNSYNNDKSSCVNIKVIVRCRPLNEKEKNDINNEEVVRINNNEVILTINRNNEIYEKKYSFDYACDKDVDQKTLFNNYIYQIVDEVLEGFNCTLFCYGQTGTGKTYTMEGKILEHLKQYDNNKKVDLNESINSDMSYCYELCENEDTGLIFRVTKRIFDILNKRKEEKIRHFKGKNNIFDEKDNENINIINKERISNNNNDNNNNDNNNNCNNNNKMLYNKININKSDIYNNIDIKEEHNNSSVAEKGRYINSDIVKNCSVHKNRNNDIYQGLEDKNMYDFNIKISYLEIYNEELCDLLSSTNENMKLRIYEDSNNKSKGLNVDKLEEKTINSFEEIYYIICSAIKKRRTAETAYNKKSSRSHSIFTITLIIKDINSVGESITKIGKLNLVDLAGSENALKSSYGSLKIRQQECCNINQSLLTLGRVINSLIENSSYIPYRDSKLTRLLQDSLGGKTKTFIVATISPSSLCIDETLSTLDYVFRAKNIKNRPEINIKTTKQLKIKDLNNEIEKLRNALNLSREKRGVYLDTEEYNNIQNCLKKNKEILLEKEKILFEKSKKIKNLLNKMDNTDDLQNKIFFFLKDTIQKYKNIQSFHQILIKKIIEEKYITQFLLNKYHSLEENYINQKKSFEQIKTNMSNIMHDNILNIKRNIHQENHLLNDICKTILLILDDTKNSLVQNKKSYNDYINHFEEFNSNINFKYNDTLNFILDHMDILQKYDHDYFSLSENIKNDISQCKINISHINGQVKSEATSIIDVYPNVIKKEFDDNQNEKGKEYESESEKGKEYESESEKGKEYESESEKGKEYESESEKGKEYESESEKGKEYESESEKGKEYESESEKGKEYESESENESKNDNKNDNKNKNGSQNKNQKHNKQQNNNITFYHIDESFDNPKHKEFIKDLLLNKESEHIIQHLDKYEKKLYNAKSLIQYIKSICNIFHIFLNESFLLLEKKCHEKYIHWDKEKKIINDNIQYIYKEYEVLENNVQKENNIIINNYKKNINDDIQEFKENILKDVESVVNKNVEVIYQKINNKLDLLNKELYYQSNKNYKSVLINSVTNIDHTIQHFSETNRNDQNEYKNINNDVKTKITNYHTLLYNILSYLKKKSYTEERENNKYFNDTLNIYNNILYRNNLNIDKIINHLSSQTNINKVEKRKLYHIISEKILQNKNKESQQQKGRIHMLKSNENIKHFNNVFEQNLDKCNMYIAELIDILNKKDYIPDIPSASSYDVIENMDDELYLNVKDDIQRIRETFVNIVEMFTPMKMGSVNRDSSHYTNNDIHTHDHDDDIHTHDHDDDIHTHDHDDDIHPQNHDDDNHTHDHDDNHNYNDDNKSDQGDRHNNYLYNDDNKSDQGDRHNNYLYNDDIIRQNLYLEVKNTLMKEIEEITTTHDIDLSNLFEQIDENFHFLIQDDKNVAIENIYSRYNSLNDNITNNTLNNLNNKGDTNKLTVKNNYNNLSLNEYMTYNKNINDNFIQARDETYQEELNYLNRNQHNNKRIDISTENISVTSLKEYQRKRNINVQNVHITNNCSNNISNNNKFQCTKIKNIENSAFPKKVSPALKRLKEENYKNKKFKLPRTSKE